MTSIKGIRNDPKTIVSHYHRSISDIIS